MARHDDYLGKTLSDAAMTGWVVIGLLVMASILGTLSVLVSSIGVGTILLILAAIPFAVIAVLLAVGMFYLAIFYAVAAMGTKLARLAKRD